jgi:galactoside O-acetyltransferase
MTFLSQAELTAIGFASLGKDVRISDRCSVYAPHRIHIGDRTRIDDFCILSAGDGGISIGSNIHIACYTSLIGAARIELHDFANLSSRVSIYSSNDDYSGEYMTNPTVLPEFTNVTAGPVVIERHVIVGAGAVILPNVRIGLATAVGALSLVKANCDPFSIYAGIPARRIKDRSPHVIALEQQYRDATARHA